VSTWYDTDLHKYEELLKRKVKNLGVDRDEFLEIYCCQGLGFMMKHKKKKTCWLSNFNQVILKQN
jgi:hypothetical protein